MASSAIVVKQDIAKLLQKAGLKGILAVALGGAYVLAKLLRAWKLRKTPPGSFGLPLLGEMIQFITDRKKFAETRVKKYGPVFTTHLLFSPCVYLAGPVCKEVFKNRTIAWPSSWTELLGEHSMSVINGEPHKKQRSIAAKAFTPEALASYVPRLQEVTQKHLERWAEKGQRATERYIPTDDIQKYTFEIAEKLLLGRSTGESDEGLIKTCKTTFAGLEALVPFNLPFTAHGKGMRARAEIMKEYQKILDEKRKSGTEGHKDMLALVMNAKDEQGQGMTEEQLLDFCLVIMFAGHDTTKVSISSMMHLLAKEPDVERQLAEEVDKLWDGTSPITWGMVEKLEQGKCGAFIAEQLRLLPPVNMLFRFVTEDTEVNGYTIPKGWKIVTSPTAAHTYLAGDKQNVDFSIDHSKFKESEYMPFGGGARKCIGYRFARVELLVWMLCVFKHYKIDIDAKESVMLGVPFNRADVKIRLCRRS